MRVRNECSFLTLEAIKKIEEKYNAKYVLETCVRGKDENWLNFPAAIFYTETAHPDGSNYFAMYIGIGGNLVITDGISAVEGVIFKGIENNGEVVYSRYRHDYREQINGDFIDGGRDYTRYGGSRNMSIVEFKVVKDKIEFVKELHNV